jgi:hypothetical protein
MFNKRLAWTLVLALLCVLIGNAAQAGNCHGNTNVKQSVRVGTAVEADESVAVCDGNCVTANESVVAPGVEADESVVVDGGSVTARENIVVNGGGGPVTVTESVTIGAPGRSAGAGGAAGGPPPVGVRVAKKDARAAKRAAIAEAVQGRKAGRFARKSNDSAHESMNSAAVKRIYEN